MKRILPLLIALCVLLAFAATVGWLYVQSREDPVVYETETPGLADIVNKTVATGAVVPRNEVELKPRVSGVIEEIHVEPGEVLERGALVATIRIIPDSVRLNSARSQLRSADLSLDDARRRLERLQTLHGQGLLADAELEEARTGYDLRQAERAAAASNLQLVREGAAAGAGEAATEVRATVAGMVLSVPVREGESVIESNTFNAGTTIATVADMTDMIFEGTVDESEVGKIREGMELAITVAAFQRQQFPGTLEYISPKGVLDRGAVQFEIRASITIPGDVFVRAESSANADIVLDSRTQVLALRESLLQFEGQTPYVEVEVGEQEFERRDVELGLSDGIHIEVLSGVDAEARVKRPLRDG